MAWWKILLIGVGVVITGIVGVVWYFITFAEVDMWVPVYQDNCASCHGDELAGTADGPPLIAGPLSRGDDVNSLQDSIRNAHPNLGQPAFVELTDLEVKGLSIYVGERRIGQRFSEFRYDREIELADGNVVTEAASFRVEPFADNLSSMVFSIEPMPDGSMLLTEKLDGLYVISPDGVKSEAIKGTPQTGDTVNFRGIHYGSGWLLDVALHPQYEENGWIYLNYTHLCGEDCEESFFDASMHRLDRGRIRDGEWVDVETIWKATPDFYQPTPDTGAGGRIAFDDDGHVFISMGIKFAAEGGLQGDTSAQDLEVPYGKIHRVNDDGTIPLDNPFVVGTSAALGEKSFALQSIWTYGHRSPQGLEWNAERGFAWNSEMGPRGGDELNELKPGRNYGWPFFSLGMEYSGMEVARHKPKGLEFDASEVEQTLVDITPSPAISSFTFYDGNAFPGWQGNVLIGSLKGSSLFRMVFDGNKLVHRETVVKDLARIRDVEVGYDGFVYLLLETVEESRIVRLVPTS